MGQRTPPMVAEIANCAVTLPDGRLLLQDVNLTVAAGESVALVGRSGSGKTTLLTLLGLMATPQSGTLTLAGQPVTALKPRQRERLRGRQIGFVFQRFNLIGHLSVIENVMVPLRHGGGLSVKRMRMRAKRRLEEVGLGESLRKYPAQLSGGEQQRVSIARALVGNPSILLADEPTGALDEENGNLVVDLMLRLVRERGAGLLIVTHDLELAARMDRCYRIASGTVAEVPSAHGAHS